MTPSEDHSIERLALAFLDRSLPRPEWTHASHFAVALWLLRHRPALTAPEEIRKLIMGYNEATGTANTETGGYHHTITLASLRAAAGVLYGHGADVPLHGVLQALMLSPLGHREWLLSHWRQETLSSVRARRIWVEPDLAPLPYPDAFG
ncbi:DUF2891 domain-containing protein [Methylorubrum thiocyanatum]|jgi:hypothetical protein